MARPRLPRLLTLDAFGTIFHPKQPIAQQYVAEAVAHGLQGLNESAIAATFRDDADSSVAAFRTESRKHPNYGKEEGMKASEWWANVIKSTFQPLLPPSTPVPPRLIPSLLHRFSTSAAYTLYSDIPPFLHRLQTSNPAPPILGVITNSDNRVPGILSSLGLRIRLAPSPYEKNEKDPKGPSDRRKNPDIAFVAMSYDIDAEKPHRAMFDAARRLGAAAAGLSLEEGRTGLEEWECMHVGDDLEKDYRGAENAGWRAVFLDREGRGQGTGEKEKMRRTRKGRGEEMVSRVASLDDLVFC